MSRQQRAVIIFKSESESTDVYIEELQRHSFKPIFVPTLSFIFKDLNKLRDKLLSPDEYAGIIFTSPRCVEAVCRALQNNELPSNWKLLHNYAVGEVTHNLALTELQQLFTHGKKMGTARSLAEYIIETFDGNKEKPFLLPCSNLVQDTLHIKLTEADFLIDALEVYETKCNTNFNVHMEEALKEENIEYMAFFSPSGVNCTYDWFKAHNRDLGNSRLVAIGPSTRRALESKGLNVYCTAERPTVEHLIKVLINPQSSRERIRADGENATEKDDK